jgi:ParB family transcriptional regulator, chromosome partitioning protein
LSTVEVLHSSETCEWYTPARYVEAVRQVLGFIDLDPASCAQANETVKARRYFGIEDNGLIQTWDAETVFLNPPYGKTAGRSNQAIWLEKMISEFQRGAFDRGILLVNACTGDKWFKPLWDYQICFTDHRIKFDGNGSSPTKSNAFVYFGRNKFMAEFEKIGTVR